MVTEADERDRRRRRSTRSAIDLVAADQDDAARRSSTASGSRARRRRRCDTAGLTIDERDMPLQYQLLQLLVNPNDRLPAAAGRPGRDRDRDLQPRADPPRARSGSVSLLLGAYGTAQLPVTAAGIALLVVGIALLIAEAHLPTHGILGVVGVIALAVVGPAAVRHRLERVRGLGPGRDRGRGAARRRAGLRGQRRRSQRAAAPVRTGREELIGATRRGARAARPGRPGVRRRRALAGAGSPTTPPPDDAERVRERGARVRVEAVEGLTLRVRPLAEARRSRARSPLRDSRHRGHRRRSRSSS